jgi:hypothetical protein
MVLEILWFCGYLEGVSVDLRAEDRWLWTCYGIFARNKAQYDMISYDRELIFRVFFGKCIGDEDVWKSAFLNPFARTVQWIL